MARKDQWGDTIITLSKEFDVDKQVAQLLEMANDPNYGVRDEDDPLFTPEQVENAYTRTIEEIIDSIKSYPDEWFFDAYRRDYTDHFRENLTGS